MKARLFVLIGILCIVSAVMIGPVAAATTGEATVTGNPKIAISISLNLSSVYLDLDPAASPANNASLGIIVSSNTASFYIQVNDSTERPGDLGYMGNFTTIYQTSPLDTNLTLPISLTGATNGTTAAQSITPPITSYQNLYLGGGKVNNQLLAPNTFSQVVGYDDTRLPPGSEYRIEIMFEIGAT